MAGFRHSYVTFVVVAYVGAMSAGAAESTDSDSSTLGEIVVTAQKRSESLMNVPIAVTAVSGDSLKSLGAVSTGDLKLVTPGLVYDSLDGFPFFYIRGVGTDFSQPGVSSAVGIYSDGIYQNFAQAQAQSLLDVERVEVLKGPQGTLYGRNSTAGAINIVTRKPSTDDWIGDFTVGFSNYAGQAISGYLSGPIADGFSTSLAGFYNRRESYIFNGATGGRLPEVTSEGVRTKLDYDFANSGNVEVALWYFRNVDDEAGAFNQLQADATGVVLGGHASAARGLVYNDFPVFFNLTQFGTHIKANLPFEYFDLVSLTGFQRWQSDSGVDFDATSAPLAFFFSNSPTKTVSQEFQLVSKAPGPLQWVGGLYYLYNSGAFDPLNVPAGSTPPLTINDPLELIRTSSTAKASAIYGQGSYKFGADDAWRVTVGGRYSREKAAENPATVSVQGIGQVAAIPGADTTFTNFSPKATIDYTTTNSLTYFTVSKGFKSGAYNLTAPGDLMPVQPEKLTAYELGYKLTFAEGKARLEASLYDYDYRDLQVEFITNQTAPVSLGNADKATSRGLELSLVTQPITGLNLNAVGQWIRDKWRRGLFRQWGWQFLVHCQFLRESVGARTEVLRQCRCQLRSSG
jgi:iron complex outermembrane receptor protein